MKNIYFLVLALCFFGFASAQIVNIPDANFKASLINSSPTNYIAKNLSNNYFKIDANNNGQIELTEASEVSDLALVSLSISDLTGISNFNNLAKLTCQSNSLTTINLSANASLLDLDCSNNQITIINTHLNLIKLNCSNNQLTAINVSNNINLQDLVCNNNQLTSLNINNNINLITLSCNSNQLNTLNANVNASIKYVSCEFNQLTSISLNSNCCLETLYCRFNQLTSIDVSNYANIRYLNCEHNQISSLDVSNNPALFSLNCSDNLLAAINVNSNTILNKFYCSGNQLTSLNVDNNIYLNTLRFSRNQITSINLNNNIELEFLNCGNNQLTILNLSALVNLQYLGLEFNSVSNLDLSSLTYLQDLDCSHNFLTNINLNSLVNLRTIACDFNQLPNLNLNSLVNLETLNCSSNSITTLDFSGLTKFRGLYCSFNYPITTIIIKNNNLQPWSFLHFPNNPNLRYICADLDDLNFVQNKITSYGYTNCQVNNYCSFNPGGNFYTIQGNQKFDINDNGCDSLDNLFPNLKFNISDGTNLGSFISDNTGDYSIPVQAGTHTVTPVLENPTYFNISPTNVVVTFPSQTSPVIQNFCVTANGSHPDAEINMLPIISARPGFDAFYKLIYKNKGNMIQSGSVNISFNDSVLDLVSSLPTLTTQTLDNLTWDFTNLQPFETREIVFTLNVNSPTATPAVNGGDILNYVATITSATTDETPNDNSFIYNQTVVNSFDPNDKTCLEGATISQSKVGGFVHYMIRFENNGTANAQNIVVKDMIDLAKFDINSLVPIKGSHSFVTNISASNRVEFIFENINLPFDNYNNDGYVAFKIKTKSTLVSGNTFTNTASIYFDYNFPIITNTATTTIQALANQDFEFASYFTIYPNPVKDVLKIDFKNSIEVQSINIYNTLGQLVLVIPNAQNTNNVDVSSLKSGNYFVKINSDKGTSSSKFIKQ